MAKSWLGPVPAVLTPKSIVSPPQDISIPPLALKEESVSDLVPSADWPSNRTVGFWSRCSHSSAAGTRYRVSCRTVAQILVLEPMAPHFLPEDQARSRSSPMATYWCL